MPWCCERVGYYMNSAHGWSTSQTDLQPQPTDATHVASKNSAPPSSRRGEQQFRGPALDARAVANRARGITHDDPDRGGNQKVLSEMTVQVIPVVNLASPTLYLISFVYGGE